ncbi:MAG TPA: DciA family protein [Candidatus Moranbacteria bacterium]|nr:DciA family protein [Candidatus Moranbacteria bacterium]
MKKIGSLLHKRKLAKKNIDPETVFYVFRQVIKEEYGKQGAANIVPVFFRDGKISIKIAAANWKNEIQQNDQMVVQKINQHLGGEEIKSLILEK